MSKHIRCLHVIGVGALSVVASNAYSAGFAIIENSGAGTGNAYAGISAIGTDTSTAYFNPAAMTEIDGRKFSVTGHLVNVNATYKDKGSSTNPLLGGDDITGSGYDDAINALIPNLYYIAPLSSDMTFGLAINVPFGLETDYEKDWTGRYGALNSAVQSVNINPSLAWSISDELSLGAGISAQYLHANLSNAIDSGAVCLKAAPNNAIRAECFKAGLTPANPERDGFAEVSGDNWAVAFNLGMLYKFSDRTRVGASFRSAVDHKLEGDAKFDMDPTLQAFLTNAGSTAFTDTSVNATANLPASISLSAFHQLDDKIQLLADITWTQWSSFEELRVKFDNPAQPDAVTTEAWEDVMRYSVGMNYKHSDLWTFRTGVALDVEPIPDIEHRTARIPGNDRTWLSFGAGYKISPKMDVDFGYAHLFIDDTPLDHTDESTGYATRGEYKSNVNIFSAQLNWHFD